MSEPPPLAPRVLAKSAAAAYRGLTESGFDHRVSTGKLPGPLRGTRRWDKVAIDLALNRLSGIDRSKPGGESPESQLAKFLSDRAARDAARASRSVAPPITKRRGANRDRI